MMKGPAEIAHGPMFIGFTFNVFLFGMMTTQVYLYYTNFRRDRLWMKLFVFLIFILDTINSVCDCVYLYDSLILHFGDMDVLGTANWLFATDPALTGVIAALVQLFFAWRVVILTKNWFLGGIVILGAITGGVCSVITAWEVIKTPYFTEFQNFKVVVIVWLVVASLVDVIITMILVWFLRKHKTGFKHSDLMVNRIIRLTVQTGLITSIVAIVDLIVYLTDPTGTHLIFNFPLCKLYTNSLMSSLNCRRGWKYPTVSESSERPGVEIDVEESTSGHGAAVSQVGDDSSWKAKRVSGSQGTGMMNGTKKFTADIFNLRSRQRTSPEVFVHVESHELRDVSRPQNPSALVSSENRLRVNHDTFGLAREVLASPVDGGMRTVVLPVNEINGGRQGSSMTEKPSSIYTESDSDEPRKSAYP